MNLDRSFYGFKSNKQGGYYRRGRSYSLEKKLEVAEVYLLLRERKGGARPTINQVARQTKTTKKFVLKVEKELQYHGRVLDLKEIEQSRPSGPGSICLDEFDVLILLKLREMNPQQC